MESLVMSSKLTIPKKLKVGYKNTDSTTNGKLGYVVFYDLKTGLIKREVSLDSWRSREIETNDFENEATSGFIFSRNISRSGFYRGSKIEKVRVYDPRGFDIEINISNLMHIIEHCNIENCEIKGDLIYGWDGMEMNLIPTNSEVYRNSVDASEKLTKRFATKDLEVGMVYDVKSGSSLDFKQFVYLGRFAVNDYISGNSGYRKNKLNITPHYADFGKQHIFAPVNSECLKNYEVVKIKNIVDSSYKLSDLDVNLAILDFEKSINCVVFDTGIYINTIRKDLLIDQEKHKEIFPKCFLGGRDIYASYNNYSFRPHNYFNGSGFGFCNNEFKSHSLGINNSLNKIAEELDFQLQENEPNIANSIKAMLDILSKYNDWDHLYRLDTFFISTVFYSYIKMHKLYNAEVGFIRNRATVRDFDNKYDHIFSTKEFTDYIKLANCEFFKLVNVFYVSAMMDLDGNNYSSKTNTIVTDLLSDSYKIGELIGDEVVWIDIISKNKKKLFQSSYDQELPSLYSLNVIYNKIKNG